jgi:hypothetical protein
MSWFKNIPMIGNHSGAKVKGFHDLKFWAENGQIRVVDETTGDLKVVPVRDWLERARSFIRGTKADKYSDEYNETMNLVDQMIAVAREARTQGDPHDPIAMKHLVNTYGTHQFSMTTRASEVPLPPEHVPTHPITFETQAIPDLTIPSATPEPSS